MKKPNIELNELKLNQKKIQLNTLLEQLTEVSQKAEQVKKRFDAKQLEVYELEAYIEQAKSQANNTVG